MSDEQDRPAMLSDLAALKNELDSVIREEGKTTRRHFDIVAERMNDTVKLVAELASHHSTVLDDHETRIQKIERGR
jgi:ElaB/YqjD/DUF883 family membrane-anchored ribosome-binding protein